MAYFSFSVFEILLKVSEGKPWKETLLEVLPQRKFRIGGRQRKRKSQNSIDQLDSEEDNTSDNEPNHEENSLKNQIMKKIHLTQQIPCSHISHQCK